MTKFDAIFWANLFITFLCILHKYLCKFCTTKRAPRGPFLFFDFRFWSVSPTSAGKGRHCRPSDCLLGHLPNCAPWQIAFFENGERRRGGTHPSSATLAAPRSPAGSNREMSVSEVVIMAMEVPLCLTAAITAAATPGQNCISSPAATSLA